MLFLNVIEVRREWTVISHESRVPMTTHLVGAGDRFRRTHARFHVCQEARYFSAVRPARNGWHAWTLGIRVE